jgi:hypothetical protein
MVAQGVKSVNWIKQRFQVYSFAIAISSFKAGKFLYFSRSDYYFLSYGIVSMLAENIGYLKYFVVFDMLSCL